MNTPLRTSDIVKATQTGREALRFYEKNGLIRKPKKSLSGYREYTLADIQKIRFIKMSQEVGFTLKEIKAFLTLGKNKRLRRRLVQENIDSKLAMVKTKIDVLLKMKGTLESLKAQADVYENETVYCPILGQIDLCEE